MRQDLFIKYLKLLGVSKKEPNMEFLNELVKAHLIRVPFENISKIYYKKIKKMDGIPNLELFLDGIEEYNFGGTCYPNNYYFNILLNYLGFNALLSGADMSKPDVHLMNIVTLDGREYIVDVGYAAPFLIPIPRDLKYDFEISQGEVKYVIKPQNAKKCSVVELYERGELRHGYIAKPEPRKIEEFEQQIENSFSEKSIFINSLFLTRFFENEIIIINNLKLTRHTRNTTSNYDIKNREELIELVHSNFNIPKDIISPVIKEMTKLNDILNELK